MSISGLWAARPPPAARQEASGPHCEKTIAEKKRRTFLVNNYLPRNWTRPSVPKAVRTFLYLVSVVFLWYSAFMGSTENMSRRSVLPRYSNFCAFSMDAIYDQSIQTVGIFLNSPPATW